MLRYEKGKVGCVPDRKRVLEPRQLTCLAVLEFRLPVAKTPLCFLGRASAHARFLPCLSAFHLPPVHRRSGACCAGFRGLCDSSQGVSATDGGDWLVCGRKKGEKAEAFLGRKKKAGRGQAQGRTAPMTHDRRHHALVCRRPRWPSPGVAVLPRLGRGDSYYIRANWRAPIRRRRGASKTWKRCSPAVSAAGNDNSFSCLSGA